MLASENDETAPDALMDADASWPVMPVPVIFRVPPLLVTLFVLIALCVTAPVVFVGAVTLPMLVSEVDATAPVAVIPAEALVPLMPPTTMVPV